MVNDSEHDRKLPFVIAAYAVNREGIILHLIDYGETGKSYAYVLPRIKMDEFLVINQLGPNYDSLTGRRVIANVRRTDGKSPTDRVTGLVGMASENSL